MEIKVKITKEILEQSAHCKWNDLGCECAIAIALKPIYPDVFVSRNEIYPFHRKDNKTTKSIVLPEEALRFIKLFDELSPEDRLLLPELEFVVDDASII